MKILWIGDAADTGFGSVTKEIGRRLLAKGYDVRFVLQNMDVNPLQEPFASRSWNEAYISPYDLGMLVKNGFGLDNWKAEQVVLLADFRAAQLKVNAHPDPWGEVITWHHVPVEGLGMPPSWAKFWQHIRPIAITKFGADEIGKLIGRQVPFVYHGIDHAIFRVPTPTEPFILRDGTRIGTKRQARRHFGLNPDHKVLLTCERHMPRKNLNAMIRAVAPILAERDDVDLLIHNRPNDFGGDLTDTVSRYPGRVLDHILFSKAHDTWRGVPAQTLAALHFAADVYLNAGAEGFGLNLANSLACGTPAIGIDYSAVPEVVGDGGILVKPAHLLDNVYDHYWCALDEKAFADAIRQALEPGMAQRLGRLGVEHVSRFDWDVAADEFAALFESVPAQQAA